MHMKILFCKGVHGTQKVKDHCNRGSEKGQVTMSRISQKGLPRGEGMDVFFAFY